MSLQQITISLPEKIYRQVQKQSQQMRRSVADEVTAVITESLPKQSKLSPELEEELAQLALLTDDELWQAAQMTAPAEKTSRIQALLDKQKLEGLTEAEKAEAELLARFFDRIMLVRAKAAVLLQERGHNIDQLAKD